MPNNAVTKPRTIEEIQEDLKKVGSGFDSRYILEKAANELENFKKEDVTKDSALYKALTLQEFDHGLLMCTVVPDRFSVFGLELFKQLQEEYKCQSPSEKSLAETVALNFIRVLAAQERIQAYLNIGSITDVGVKYLGIMSAELDRAQRHYLISLETIKRLRSPVYKVNIKTDTAIVGQNQAVQFKNA